MSAGCYLDCLDYPDCPCGVSDSGGETLREHSRSGGLRPESLAARVKVARPWLAAREKLIRAEPKPKPDGGQIHA